LKWKNVTTGEAIEMPEAYADRLHSFVENTVGMSYRLTPGSLMKRKKKTEGEKKKGYFCSELVAAAYQAMGLLPEEPQAQLYWPGTFQHRLASTVKFNERMRDSVGSECTARPILDKEEHRILWEGVDVIPASTSKRGGCFG
jgi:hypothetical protein